MFLLQSIKQFCNEIHNFYWQRSERAQIAITSNINKKVGGWMRPSAYNYPEQILLIFEVGLL